MQQKNIERYVKERYANDNGTGHTITTLLEGTNIRVMMQNPRGVMKGNKNNGGKRDGHLDYTHLTQLRDLHVDILGLPETNLNWRNVHIRVQWERVVRRVWPRSRIFYSAIKSEDNNEVHRQGGVCLIVTCKWAPSVEEATLDDVGRWVSITLKGQGKKRVTVITAYRPGDGSVTSNSGTVWRQQYDYFMSRDIGTEVKKFDPRKK